MRNVMLLSLALLASPVMAREGGFLQGPVAVQGTHKVAGKVVGLNGVADKPCVLIQVDAGATNLGGGGHVVLCGQNLAMGERFEGTVRATGTRIVPLKPKPRVFQTVEMVASR